MGKELHTAVIWELALWHSIRQTWVELLAGGEAHLCHFYRPTSRSYALFRHCSRNMLLLISCKVHTAKYADRMFRSTDRIKWCLYEKLRSEYFPYGTNNWLVTHFLVYSQNNFSEDFWNAVGTSWNIFRDHRYQIKAISVRIYKKTS